MAESSLDSLRQTRVVQVQLRAYELRPENSPPIPPEVEALHHKRVAEHWPRVQQIARERFGLELKRMDDPRPHPTRLAHIGAKFAVAQGFGDAYHRAVFRAHWHDLRDISAPDTLLEIARAIGLDQAGFGAALGDPDYRADVEADQYWAWTHNVAGVPAFIFSDRYVVSGAQPVEVLQHAVDQCLADGLDR
jgi:predicted DsbA family dithiol-disulfide isomerase